MKRMFWVFIFGISIFTQVLSEDMDVLEYGNTKLGMGTHSFQFAEDTKATPVYAQLKYKFFNNGSMTPYLKGDMGYNYIEDENSEGNDISNMADSRYYSLGVGLDMKNDLSLEAAYENYQITPDNDEDDGRMVLKFGYKY